MIAFSLTQAAIAFPNIDPIIFQIGPVAIRWYSLGYIVGIVFGWWYAKQVVRRPRLWGGTAPLKPADLDDFMLWATIGIILGGRLGYVLFYDFEQYLANPLDILKTWNGGMSFHGGMLGVVIAMFVFARSRKIPVSSLFDVIALVAPIGIGLVRVTNFINGELWGRVTDVPWAMVFTTGGPEPRHPSQLYEAVLEGLVLALVLFAAVFKFEMLKRPRFVTGLFAAGYGIARTIVEFFRQPDVQLGYLYGDWLTMGMILSMPMIVIGLALIASARPMKTQ